jgi:hypothetical protein
MRIETNRIGRAGFPYPGQPGAMRGDCLPRVAGDTNTHANAESWMPANVGIRP